MLPTLIVAFDRPQLLERLLRQLAQHAPSPVFIAFDGPRENRPHDREQIARGIASVKELVTWTDRVEIRAAERNLGLRRNVSSAISWALAQHDRIVVLEDDCLPGESFYRFCAEMLARYEDDARVGVVSGTTFCPAHLRGSDRSYYFSAFSHCWGWATWRRAWQCFDDDMKGWSAFQRTGLERLFEAPSARRYWRRKLAAVQRAEIESWAYRWTASCWQSDLLTIQPYVNLVDNVGFGDDGSNTAWSGDPLADRALHALQFPLRHPEQVVRSIDIDAWVQAHVFQSSLPLKVMRAYHRVRSRALRGWRARHTASSAALAHAARNTPIDPGACPLCGRRSVVQFEVPAGPIRRCLNRSCRLWFAEHQPSEAELSEQYRTLYYPESPDATPEKTQSDAFKVGQHFMFLERELGLAGKRVLDVGCGVGNFLEVCKRRGVAEMVGIETDPVARRRCAERGFRVVADPSELADATFDLVYMNDVIEHLREPWAYCRRLRRLLVADGALFAATMRIEGLKGRLLGRHWDLMRDPTHLFFFNAQSLTRTLTEAGFARVQCVDFPVTFSHHHRLRRLLQAALVRTKLDSTLKVIARA